MFDSSNPAQRAQKTNIGLYKPTGSTTTFKCQWHLKFRISNTYCSCKSCASTPAVAALMSFFCYSMELLQCRIKAYWGLWQKFGRGPYVISWIVIDPSDYTLTKPFFYGSLILLNPNFSTVGSADR
jgi:hypothetical protein